MAGTRLHVLLSLLIPILLIAPYAYHLLLVPRSPLPFDDIQAIDIHASTEALRSHVVNSETITFLQVHATPPSFPVLPRTSRVSSLEYPSLSPSIPALHDSPHAQDRALKSWLHAANLTDRAVIVLLCQDSKQDADSSVTMGVHRHGWSTGCYLSIDQQRLLVDTLFPPPSSANTSTKLALKYRFSFTVLNEKPHEESALADAWNTALSSALAPLFEPFADAVASTLAAVTIDTQRVEFGKLAQVYRVDPTTHATYVTTADLQHFKSANDFATTSVLADREHVVHFAAIPAAASFHIRSSHSADPTPEYAFVIPGYGSVAILHTPDDVPRIMRTFLFHARHLLGLGAFPSSATHSITFLPSSSGVADWELDILVNRYLLRHYHTTVRTLQSLASLVASMPQMAVLPRTSALVESSLAALHDVATSVPKAQTFRTKLVAVRHALLAVEEAYYDPTMVSQLYFPEDQIYFVFCPLLLPLLVPLLGGVVREVKRMRKPVRVVD
ncbi:hypothetical protein, variant [Aphanomyces astaci]|uniref:GPI transamidase component PIG-S n=1 Tax=Aphanomyces astaci TaxID=112090 RepID=W4FTY1_APHAT|nr:hypothetical protein, variant [Aphanomyces astaci]ETV70416.1 hypothetical protein, variant [Aphanomyces astaci]|eukprot:XP_009840128.1 hypothetical protein, variant [Aphanomyces astaci]